MDNKFVLNKDVIDEAVKKKHLTKAYVSNKCGYASEYLSHSMLKGRPVAASVAKMVADILELDVEDIIVKPKASAGEDVQIEFLTAENLRKCTDIDTVVRYLNAANEAFGNIMKGMIKANE